MMSDEKSPQSDSRVPSVDHVSRRSFMGAVGSAAIFGGTAFARGIDTVEIPYIKSGDEVLVRKEVPKPWYQQVQRSKDAQERAFTKFANEAGVAGVSLARGKDTFGGKPGHRIRLHVDPDEFNGAVPDQVNDVDVETAEARDEHLQSCVHYDDFSDVQGGITTEAYWEENGEEYLGYGTTCLRVEIEGDDDNTQYMLTAHHLWPDNCTQVSNEWALQNGSELGGVADSDVETDIALIQRTNSNKSFEGGINDETFNWDVSGYYTESSVSDMMSEGRDDLRSMGVTTGVTKGAIEDMNYYNSNSCITWQGEGVVLDASSAEGDSGGPMYGLEEYFGNQYAVMLGLNSVGFNDAGTTQCTAGVASGDDRVKTAYIGGTGWYHLEENSNITIS